MIIPLALDRVRLAALVGLVVFASPMGGAPADKPVDRVSSVDDPGRIPYQSVAQQGAGGTQFNFKFPAVPPGRRLVIEHISGDLLFQSPPTRDVQAAALVSFGAASAFFVSFSNEPSYSTSRFNSTSTQATAPLSLSKRIMGRMPRRRGT